MKPYILPLSGPQADLETTGGKGASLSRLVNAGLPVPDGFHITTQAYRHFVSANDLQAGILDALQQANKAHPATLEEASHAIRSLFAGASIPSELASAIVEAYGSLPGSNPAVAVRSSATAEDLPGASFAGQQETYLNISGADGVLEAVKDCWASLWTGRAISYRLRQGIPPQGVALAVVVQLLVDAEAAGILFTTNPLNARRDEMVINAAWGLGEAVVGGAVTPDTVTVSKADGKVIRRETAEKQVMTVRTASGTAEQPVPDSLRSIPVLSNEKTAELARLGLQIEELYGMPMDIEWALGDGQFTILQARPVTALPEAPIEWVRPKPKGVFMRGSVVDLLPDPLSPLFVTLGLPSLRQQMRPMAKRVIGTEPDLGEYYFSHINTYAYMSTSLPLRGWLWVFFRQLPAYPRLLRQLLPLWRDEMHPHYQAFVLGLKDKQPAEVDSTDLWRTSQEIVDAAMYYVCALLFATMGASAGAEILTTRAYDKLAKREGDPPASVLLMGWDNIPARSEKSLYDLAMWARQDGELTAYLLGTPTESLAAQLDDPHSAPPSLFAEFAARFQAHLEQFGHIIFQLDFAADLPLDHPEPMLENIKMYLRGEGTNPHERQRASQQKRIQTGEAALSRLKGWRRWVFSKALRAGQAMAEVREDALADIGLGYPMLRAMLCEMGRRFVAVGAIQQADDIFWLEKAEIDALVGGESTPHQAQVAQRKEYWKRLKRETPPPMIPMRERVMGVKADIFVAQSQEGQAADVIKGVPTSGGKVTAPACVLHGPADFEQMRPGDVLVAGATTPAWTPLFAMASAVVTDIGGPLSHGSIVAREYGIPAVMGTGVATRRITDGQTITVDGDAGTVLLGNGKS
jgi:pyruvate,water dikinase